MRRGGRRAGRRAGAAALALAGVVTAVGGCSSASPASPPSGVDGLVVPTPDPRPSDFVATVTNPWFPLPVGARWVYGAEASRGAEQVSVAASEGPRVEGVATTRVRTTTRLPGPGGISDVVDLYAQDTAGNVWWFGHRTTLGTGLPGISWRAGRGGAEAGLLVPATPRLGDGYRSALVPGRLDARATVVSLEGEADAEERTYEDTLVVDTVDAVGSSSVRCFYARGTGLVVTQPVYGTIDVETTLRSYRP